MAASVKHLVRAEDDISFRLNFLQPLTTACLTASKRKKASAQFSADNVLLEVIIYMKKFYICLFHSVLMQVTDYALLHLGKGIFDVFDSSNQ